MTLSALITDFFMSHLARERDASKHTVMAYRDALKMLLSFAARIKGCTVDRLRLEDLFVEVILEFLNYLEKTRGEYGLKPQCAFGRHSFFFPLCPVPGARGCLLLSESPHDTL
ncbi:MAG: site-specific integrase [Syntrophales bacterium]